MRKTPWCFIAALLVLVSACERKPATSSPARYDKSGVSFQYPGNWSVDQDEGSSIARTIVVESSGSALLLIQLFDGTDIEDIRDYAEFFAKAGQEEVQVGKMSRSTFSEIKSVDGYEVLTENFAIELLGQSVPHTRIYRRKDTGKGVYFLISQTASEDAAIVEPGFAQIVSTFKGPS